MNSYYTTWSHGSHKGIECVECHIPPGLTNYAAAKLNGLGQVVDDVLDRTGPKPSAVVSDRSCTREGCHDINTIRAQSRHDGKYFFDHGKHLDLDYLGIKVHCTTCHAHVRGDQHFEVNTSTCITCHLARPDQSTTPDHEPGIQMVRRDERVQPTSRPVVMAASLMGPGEPQPTRDTIRTDNTIRSGGPVPPSRCDACHAAPSQPVDYQGLKVVHAEFAAYGAACESCHHGVTQKARSIRDEQCYECHEFGTERLKGMSVAQTHQVHIEGRHKVECYSCHGMPQHGPAVQAMRLNQLECQSCHSHQHEIQQVTYKSTHYSTTGPDVAASAQSPSTQPVVTPMFLAHVDCSGCHTQPRPLGAEPQSGARVAVATAQACDTCHKPGLGEEMIPLWQGNTHALYDAAVKLLPSDERALPSGVQRRVTEARQLLDIVRIDGSWGVHNPRYTQKLLEDARAKLLEANQIMHQQARGVP